MVSERYPRDEDYASDADSDFSDEVPPWLFADMEEEDVSQIQQQNDHLNIVFGNIYQDSDLEIIVVAAPLISVKTEFSESTIKIGEISCPFAAVKETKGEGSFKNDIESQLLDLEISTTDLQSNTTVQEIKTVICDFASDCDNRSRDETAASTLGKEIAKEEIKQRKPSITMADFILAATEESTNPDHVSLTKSVFLAPDLIHHSSFIYGMLVECVDFVFGYNVRITNQAMKVDSETTKKPSDPIIWFSSIFNRSLAALQDNNDDFVCAAKSFPNPFVFNHSVFVWLDFIFTAPDQSISFVEDGKEATSIESRRKQEVVLRKPPDLLPRQRYSSCCWSSLPWKMKEEDWLLLADQGSLVCSPESPSELHRREATDLFVGVTFCIPWFPGHVLGHNFGPYHLRPCLFGLG